MRANIKLLDCTLRDGGLGLEDAFEKGISSKQFRSNDYKKMVQYLKASRMEIIELGSVQITTDDRKGFAIFQNIEQLSAQMPTKVWDDQMYVGLYRGPDTPLKDIPDWRPGLVDGVRVILRYSELQKSLDFCSALAEKGYRVFVQPMLTMRYLDEELDMIIEASNRMKAYALYFVDSYGYMMPEDVERLFQYYDKKLDQDIYIGFHSHNNINMAYANAQHFLKIAGNRPIIVDACATGMGQGAGNLQTELIAFQLDKDGRYEYEHILNVCEIIETYSAMNVWGYSVTTLLPALYQTAYKYSIVLRMQYKFSFAQINAFLKELHPDMRFRYTAENLEKVLTRRAGK